VLADQVVRQSYPDLAMAPGRVQVEFQPLGRISALRLALIGGVSDGTKVSGIDDKTNEHQHPVVTGNLSLAIIVPRGVGSSMQAASQIVGFHSNSTSETES